MAKEETNIVHRIQLEVSKHGSRLFKNVRGLFWTLDQRAKVAAGLQVPGGSDLVGFTPVKVTQDMVGTTVAIFTVIEVKTATGRVSPEQAHFIDVVQKNGGYAGVARCAQDALKIMQLKVDACA